MLSLVAATADALVERLASAPETAGLFLDFDGVLAPIVARPEDAAIPAETRAELRRLAARYRLVSVVSGRPGDDVRSRVGLDEIVYVGSHGLELDPEAEAWRRADPRVRRRLTVAGRADRGQGAVGRLPLPRPRGRGRGGRRARGDRRAGPRRGLAARFGRKVLEVLPPLDSNKGTAVRRLLESTGLTRALVAGDDTTDLDAFRAVEGLECRVRVAVSSVEAPSLLREHADVVVESTGEFLELLRKL